ncbi:AFR415Cp [Eremothecium gossypii ATCC 10895]|uniref:AFR415Cp n=1 Tax=Eremothecium gossypii (strain ATCC 10895 / CBS 109.51 / FGSC 9923 / NRRL Y-1056) TaxID=284811 RepID=Q753A9_EREGS|nr:AFR415Cp [Eremothecium gossypii ATCC 10895]AAS53786.1 AFR415Cp [Eremothecium gossypii ATCC 10895]AEY98098.1 FAFR415Cp [Eremothecium gossypii FDAG1]
MTLQKLRVSLRIAVVQLNPQIGHVEQTTSRAWFMLEKLKGDCLKDKLGQPDIVVFPEFALTGYNFSSRGHILPYASRAGEGASYALAKKVSELFGCVTVIGYPEREYQTPDTRLYNSALVVGSNGQVLFNYRKAFLYTTDENWGCCENPEGFQQLQLTFKQKGTDERGRSHDVTLASSIGICMDISPYRFEAPFNDYEFATFNVDRATELIICPMAWLHSVSVTKYTEDIQRQKQHIDSLVQEQELPMCGMQGNYQFNLHGSSAPVVRIARDDPEIEEDYKQLDHPDQTNVNYWILRFLPFLALKKRVQWFYDRLLLPTLRKFKRFPRSYIGASANKPWEFENRNAILVVANRCGIEDRYTIYSGSSGIFKFNGQYGNVEHHLDSRNLSVELLGNLGKGREGILMRSVEFDVNRDL